MPASASSTRLSGALMSFFIGSPGPPGALAVAAAGCDDGERSPGHTGRWTRFRGSLHPHVVRPDADVDDGREDATDERTGDRDPGIPPIRIALARNRQDGVDDPRPEVAGGVDGISGRATEGETDHEHKQRNRQGAEGTHGGHRAVRPE